jgi:hypothetical protein
MDLRKRIATVTRILANQVWRPDIDAFMRRYLACIEGLYVKVATGASIWPSSPIPVNAACFVHPANKTSPAFRRMAREFENFQEEFPGFPGRFPGQPSFLKFITVGVPDFSRFYIE